MREKTFKVINSMQAEFILLEGDLLYLEIPGKEGMFYRLRDYDWPAAIRDVLKPYEGGISKSTTVS